MSARAEGGLTWQRGPRRQVRSSVGGTAGIEGGRPGAWSQRPRRGVLRHGAHSTGMGMKELQGALPAPLATDYLLPACTPRPACHLRAVAGGRQPTCPVLRVGGHLRLRGVAGRHETVAVV